jgi:tRNA(fMet)-specific endonuclease VapC
VILDSTFVNDLVRGQADADTVLDELIDAGTPVALSSVTVFEVGVGLRGEAEQYRQRFAEVVSEMEVAPLDVAEARCALTVQRDLYDRGEPIGAADVLIAGTAVERGEDVLTRNVDEFERVEEITVETY